MTALGQFRIMSADHERARERGVPAHEIARMRHDYARALPRPRSFPAVTSLSWGGLDVGAFDATAADPAMVVGHRQGMSTAALTSAFGESN